MSLLAIFLAAFVLSLVLTPLCRGVAIYFHVLDHPNERKLHRHPIPLLGGVAVFLSFALTIFFAGSLGNKQIFSIILGGLIISIFAVYDDISRITAASRLISQITAAFIIMNAGMVFTFLPNTLWGKIGEVILTLIWILGITNGFNYLDGLDCLAGGLVIISCSCFFIFSKLTGQPLLETCSLALAGATLGFLPYNYKRKIFLGDLSSFLGFTVAAIAITGTWAEYNVIDLTIPVLILGIPIFDMLFTTFSRVYTGKIKSLIQWMEYASLDHFHHRLLNLGLSPNSAVFFIWAVNAVLCMSALVLWGTRNYRSVLMPIVIVIQATIIFILISVLMVFGKKKKIKPI